MERGSRGMPYMINCRRGLIAGVLFLTVALTPIAAVSGPFEDGQEAFKSGDYETALSLWRPLAEQGFANALQNLGIMYAWERVSRRTMYKPTCGSTWLYPARVPVRHMTRPRNFGTRSPTS